MTPICTPPNVEFGFAAAISLAVGSTSGDRERGERNLPEIPSCVKHGLSSAMEQEVRPAPVAPEWRIYTLTSQPLR